MREIEISRKELARLYEEMPTRKLCDHYGVSIFTLYRLLDDAGIPRKLPRSGEATKARIVE